MNMVVGRTGWFGQLNCKIPRQETIFMCLWSFNKFSNIGLLKNDSCPLKQFLQDELFLDREGGGYFNTPGEDPSVLLRVKEDHDGAEPSGNSVSVINLVRLASMVSGDRSNYYRQNAEHVLVRFASQNSNCKI